MNKLNIMSANQASSLFTAPPTTLFAVLCTTFSILFGPARKIYLQLLAVLHILVLSPLIMLFWVFFIWILYNVLISPFLYTYLFGDLIYGVGKVYAGEVQPTRDSKWMSKKRINQVGTIFLYTLFVIGICYGAGSCANFILNSFEAIDEKGNPKHTKLELVLFILERIMILATVGFFLVTSLPILFEHAVIPCTRLFSLCKENFCFIYTKFLGYIFGSILLLALSLQVTNTMLLNEDDMMVCLYWWIVILIFPAITTIFPIVLYMSIRVRNEGLTQEAFANDIGSSSMTSVDTSPLIPQDAGLPQEIGANAGCSNDMTLSQHDSLHTNEGESL